MLGLHCSSQAFSSCRVEATLVAMDGFLTEVTSLVGEHGH